MPDLAQLNLVINSQPAVTGTLRLEGLARAAGQAERATGSLGSATNRLQGQMSGMVGLAARLAAGYGAITVITKALSEAANFERLNIQFETLLGSQEKAAKMMAEIEDFALKTPFDMKGLAGNAKDLLALGFAADKVLPTLHVLGDTGALLGGEDTIKRVGLALGQMQAKQKVSSEEMRQLTEAGIDAWKILANEIGVGVPEAMDLASKGMLNADKTVNALLKGMDAKFGGGMERLAKTTSGLWQQVQEKGSVALRNLGETMIQAFDIKGKLAWFLETLELVGPLIGDIIRVLGGMEAKWSANQAVAEQFATAIKIVGAVLAAIVAIKIGIFLAGIVTALVAMSPLLIKIAAVIAVIAAIVAAIELARWAYNEFRGVQEAVAAAVDAFKKAWIVIQTEFKIAWIAIKFIFIETLYWMGGRSEGFVSGLIRGFNTLKLGLNIIWEGIKLAFTNAFTAMGKVVALMIPGITKMLEAVAYVSRYDVSGIVGPLKAFEAQMNNANFATGEFQKGVAEAYGQFEKDNAQATEQAKGFVSALESARFDPLKAIGNEITDAGTAFGKAETEYTESMKKIADEFGNTTRKGQSFVDFMKGDLATTATWLKDKFSGFTGMFGSLADTGWAKGLQAQMQAAGAGAQLGGWQTQKPYADTSGIVQGPAEKDLAKKRLDLEAMLRDIQAENELVGKTAQERQRISDLHKWDEKVIDSGLQKDAKTLELKKQYITLLETQNKLQGKFEMGEVLKDTERELELVGLSAAERERVVAIRKVEDIIRERGLQGDAEALALLDRYVDKLDVLEKKKQIVEIANGIGQAFSQSFEDAILGAKNLKDALGDLIKEIQRMVFQTLVTKPLQGMISTGLTNLMGSVAGVPTTTPAPVASALGNIFSMGRLVAFANGGIVDSPMTFPMRGGRTGLMGEAGPEGILPLTRGSDGRLGVTAHGGGAVTNNNTTVLMTVNTPDAGSFRRSSRQTAMDIKRATGK